MVCLFDPKKAGKKSMNGWRSILKIFRKWVFKWYAYSPAGLPLFCHLIVSFQDPAFGVQLRHRNCSF